MWPAGEHWPTEPRRQASQEPLTAYSGMTCEEDAMAGVTHRFVVEGMHCGSCALLIDDVLEDLPGVLTTSTSVKQAITVVEVDPTRCAPDDVVGAIREAGYRARPIS